MELADFVCSCIQIGSKYRDFERSVLKVDIQIKSLYFLLKMRNHRSTYTFSSQFIASRSPRSTTTFSINPENPRTSAKEEEAYCDKQSLQKSSEFFQKREQQPENSELRECYNDLQKSYLISTTNLTNQSNQSKCYQQENQRLHQLLDKNQKERIKLVEENIDCRNRYEMVKCKFQYLQNQFTQLQQQQKREQFKFNQQHLQNENTVLIQELQAKNQEINNLTDSKETTLKEAKVRNSFFTAELQQKARTIEVILEENQHLLQQLKVSTQKMEAVKHQHYEQIQQKEGQISQLQALIKQTRLKSSEGLKSSLSLKKKISFVSDLTDSIQFNRADFGSHRDEIDHLNRELKSKNEYIAQLQTRINQFELAQEQERYNHKQKEAEQDKALFHLVSPRRLKSKQSFQSSDTNLSSRSYSILETNSYVKDRSQQLTNIVRNNHFEAQNYKLQIHEKNIQIKNLEGELKNLKNEMEILQCQHENSLNIMEYNSNQQQQLIQTDMQILRQDNQKLQQTIEGLKQKSKDLNDQCVQKDNLILKYIKSSH